MHNKLGGYLGEEADVVHELRRAKDHRAVGLQQGGRGGRVLESRGQGLGQGEGRGGRVCWED
jgi:hypothetical protein